MDSIKIEETVEQLFTEHLRENKLRRTPERYTILRAIYSINGCFEIEELQKYLEEKEKFRVSRATIYNTIALLTNANLVIHHQFGTKSKYEKCFGTEKSYMVCTKCGKVTEANNIDIKENITTNIKKFHLTHYSLYIYGLCPKCYQTTKRRRLKKK